MSMWDHWEKKNAWARRKVLYEYGVDVGDIDDPTLQKMSRDAAVVLYKKRYGEKSRRARMDPVAEQDLVKRPGIAKGMERLFRDILPIHPHPSSRPKKGPKRRRARKP